MDAKANTHFCESPLSGARSEAPPQARQSAYLIVIRGGIPGTMLRVGSEPTSLGRSADNTFPLDDMTVSRRHAAVQMDARGLVTLTDEGSTNGTFLNGSRLVAGRTVTIEEGDRIQLGSGVVMKLVRLDSSDEHFQKEMFERTVRDGLTGVYNRTYFLNQLAGLTARHAAQGIGLAILMVDVDHFKRVNDRYGHLVGDIVLREVSGVIRESTRSEDLVARYGGEEFIAALPIGSPELATERAERIRSSVSSRRIRAGGSEIRVTVSIGVAYGSPHRPIGEIPLIEAADEALYQAKAEGRNCVILGRHAFMPQSKETQSVELLTSM
jgi:two-component system cell cycle response regulator